MELLLAQAPIWINLTSQSRLAGMDSLRFENFVSKTGFDILIIWN